MTTDVFLRSYHVKHKICMKEHLYNARKISNHAVLNKNNKKLLTSKHVKQFNLPSAISNQILRKYGRGTISASQQGRKKCQPYSAKSDYNNSASPQNKKTNELKK